MADELLPNDRKNMPIKKYGDYQLFKSTMFINMSDRGQ